MPKQAGFSALEVLLVLVLVAIIGFTGVYVWQSNKSTTKTLTAAEKSGQSVIVRSHTRKLGAACQLQDGKQGKLLSMGDGRFAFCEPAGWTLSYTEVPGAFFAPYADIQYDAQQAPKIARAAGSDNNYEFSAYNKADSSVAARYTEEASSKTTAGLALTSYYHDTVANDPVGAGIDYLPQHTKQYLYVVIKDNRWLVFSYHALPGQTDLNQLVGQVAASTR